MSLKNFWTEIGWGGFLSIAHVIVSNGGAHDKAVSEGCRVGRYWSA